MYTDWRLLRSSEMGEGCGDGGVAGVRGWMMGGGGWEFAVGVDNEEMDGDGG